MVAYSAEQTPLNIFSLTIRIQQSTCFTRQSHLFWLLTTLCNDLEFEYILSVSIMLRFVECLAAIH